MKLAVVTDTVTRIREVDLDTGIMERLVLIEPGGNSPDISIITRSGYMTACRSTQEYIQALATTDAAEWPHIEWE